VATTINKVRELAESEHMAETIRDRADANWRAAWWSLTLALADVVGGDGQVKAAFAAAAKELGQSVDWLQRRRSTGQRVDLAELEYSKIRTLPPRLTVQWVGVIDGDAADALLAAEQDGVSLRDLARQQGTQPVSWQREAERAGPTPAQRQEIAREEIVRDPEIIKSVLRDQPEVEREVVRDAGVRGVERMRAAGIRPNEELDREEESTFPAITAVSLMQGVQRNLRAAIHAIRDATLDPEDQAILLGYHDSTERLLKAFGQALTGDIDAELARLLEQDSP
jgi:hypothetical protein